MTPRSYCITFKEVISQQLEFPVKSICINPEPHKDAFSAQKWCPSVNLYPAVSQVTFRAAVSRTHHGPRTGEDSRQSKDIRTNHHMFVPWRSLSSTWNFHLTSLAWPAVKRLTGSNLWCIQQLFKSWTFQLGHTWVRLLAKIWQVWTRNASDSTMS